MKSLVILFLSAAIILSAQTSIPKILDNLFEANGEIFLIHPKTNQKIKANTKSPAYKLMNFTDCLQGGQTGIHFDFRNDNLNGSIVWGFYPFDETQASYPIYFKNTAPIKEGKAKIDLLKEITRKHDIPNFLDIGKFKFGYRIINKAGEIIYDGKAFFKGKGPFELVLSITEGPFINQVTHSSAVISFKTNYKRTTKVKINNKELTEQTPTRQHEFVVNDLKPNEYYEYEIILPDYTEKYKFKTAPKPGARTEFNFAFASDCRQGKGGGERAIWGVNSYMLKKAAALASQKNSAFWQFTGDLIQGYVTDAQELRLQYANFKKTVEPFANRMPIYVGFGNHEAFVKHFPDDTFYGIALNAFPYKTNSSEAYFSDEFVNFENGPLSEDGSIYDPDNQSEDFPPYNETVYHYSYDNLAMIVLNSNYLYTIDKQMIPYIGGNLHGYVMDNQLEWFKQTIESYERDKNIDHIIVTIHTPAFPNGGHVADDMWYSGNNKFRPTIAGKAVKKGIIERRDELLDIMINQSKKTVALLCGDEHNYSRLLLSESTEIYPENWSGSRIKISRPFWHITNGAMGAPYYAKEITPWQTGLKKFSYQYALCFFHVNKKKISLEVINPDNLEEIEKVELK